MEIRLVRRSDDEIVLQVTGEVSAIAIPSEEVPLASHLGEDASSTVRIDLSQSEYIDSSGIGWLVRCHRRLKESGGRLVIHAPTPNVERTLKLMKMHRLFPIEEASVV